MSFVDLGLALCSCIGVIDPASQSSNHVVRQCVFWDKCVHGKKSAPAAVDRLCCGNISLHKCQITGT
jgi:hypothetical protein